jgi:hypothetical protein
VLSEDISNRMASTGSDNSDKLIDLEGSIQCQMLQLYSEFAQNIHKDKMRRHTKSSSKKVFEDDSFIRLRLRHGLYAGGSAISLGEIASLTFSDIRLIKVLANPYKGSRCRNF